RNYSILGCAPRVDPLVWRLLNGSEHRRESSGDNGRHIPIVLVGTKTLFENFYQSKLTEGVRWQVTAEMVEQIHQAPGGNFRSVDIYRDSTMDFIKTQLIESVFAGGGEMGARMRAFDWSATVLGPLEQWPQSLRACVRVMLGSGYPMLVCWGPAYTMLYNDAYAALIGTRHPTALGCSKPEVLPEAWDYIGPRFDRVMTRGHAASQLTDQMFTFYRHNYLEECYFSFSYSPIRDDNGNVGGVLTACLESTERVIEDRRRQALRDLASRTAEARHEEDVWRVSAETLGQHRSSVPFAFLYEYRPVERQARLVGVSVETDDDLHPTVIDCSGESIWRFHTALSEDCLVVELGQRASALSIPDWSLPAQK